MARPRRKQSAAGKVGSSVVVERLRRDILVGRLSDGERLTEANLVERFGVGRGPVREAMRDLAAQGLVLSRPNRGAIVSPEAPRPIRELITPIRRTIESFALAVIFDELTEEDFEQWEQLLSQMKSACRDEDFHQIAELDIEFPAGPDSQPLPADAAAVQEPDVDLRRAPNDRRVLPHRDAG